MVWRDLLSPMDLEVMMRGRDELFSYFNLEARARLPSDMV